MFQSKWTVSQLIKWIPQISELNEASEVFRLMDKLFVSPQNKQLMVEIIVQIYVQCFGVSSVTETFQTEILGLMHF